MAIFSLKMGQNQHLPLQGSTSDKKLIFLKKFQCTTMLIYAFCKICEYECEGDIVFVLIFRTISGSHSFRIALEIF